MPLIPVYIFMVWTGTAVLLVIKERFKFVNGTENLSVDCRIFSEVYV